MIPTKGNQSRGGRSGAGGCSPLPGSCPPKNARLVNRPYLTAKKENAYGITIYEGGHLVKLEVPKFKSQVVYDEGRCRGKVTEFSYKSRQRLMRKIAMIDERDSGLPVFLTLTYPENYSKDWEAWKRDIHTFNKVLRRKFPGAWGLWKMEFQKRGAPHFHFMLWGLPEIKGTEHLRDGKLCWRVLPGISRESDLAVFDLLNRAWFRIVGSGDEKHLAAGINLEPVQSWRGVTKYVSKYLGKTQGGEFVPFESTGRFWGVVQGQKWSVSKLELPISQRMFFRCRRVIRKLQEKVAKKTLIEAKQEGRRPPAWTKKQSSRGDYRKGIHWYLDSLTSVGLIAWAAGLEREGV